MSDQEQANSKVPKDRSPSFPFIGLPTAVERLIAFEAKFGRHQTPASKVGLAWGMKEASSQAAQTVAALKSFGMVEYEGSGPGRLTGLSEDGRNLLRAQQESVKREILRRLALNPKAIAKYWEKWGHPRPINEVCLDELVLNGAFTESAADTFLRVYDSTVGYAGLADADKAAASSLEADDGDNQGEVTHQETAQAAGATKFHKQVVPPTFAALSTGEEMDRFTVDEGVVKIIFPTEMSLDSVDELELFFELFLKKAKRRATAQS